MFVSKAARAAIRGARTVEDLKNAQAIARTSGPGLALMMVSGMGMFEGFLFFVNAISAIVEYQAVGKAVFSVMLAGGLMLGGAASLFGAYQLRTMKGKILPHWAILYSAFLPVCCVFGLPIAVWAFMSTRDPAVKDAFAAM